MSTDFADVAEPRSKGISPVIPAGIATTAVTLFANWWLAGLGFDVMGLYVWFIIPAGAIGVGMLAASGYVVAAWKRGERVGRGLLACIFILQCLAYVQAQYSDYLHADPQFDDGTPMSFPTYFDLVTRNITFEMRNAQGPAQPLGGWGYGIRFLEVLGFTCGGLLAMGNLVGSDYCEKCERYMSGKAIVTLPASVPAKKVRKSDTEGLAAQEKAETDAANQCEEMLSAVNAGADQHNSAALRKLATEYATLHRQTNKLPTRVQIWLTKCPDCAAGYLTANLVTGQGNSIKSTPLWKRPVSGDFVRDYHANTN